MANDLNRCEFIGNLGADPEVRNTQSGDQVASIRIACGWKSKNGEGTEWIPVVFFGKLAEIAGKYLHKGSKVYVAGKFRTRKWQDQSGSDRYTTEVVANELQFLDSKPKTQQESNPSAPQGGGGFDMDIPFSDPYKHGWRLI